jgi:hypothetical protein
MARTLSPGAKATLTLWGAAIAWDLICPPGQTISEAIERGLNDRHTEALVTLGLFTTVAHLMRMLDERYDIYSISFKAVGRLVERKL